MLYSKTTNGFYDKQIHKHLPEDSVEITSEQYSILLTGQCEGKIITSDSSGVPFLIDNPTSDVDAEVAERLWRDSELHRADIELNKVQDTDRKAFGTVGDWRAYRKSLRDWPQHKAFPDKSFRPIAPSA